jgi:hypothetical protein
VLLREGLWVVEGVLDYSGGREWDFVLILELHDGKVYTQREALLRRSVRGLGGAGAMVRADGALGEASEPAEIILDALRPMA